MSANDQNEDIEITATEQIDIHVTSQGSHVTPQATHVTPQGTHVTPQVVEEGE